MTWHIPAILALVLLALALTALKALLGSVTFDGLSMLIVLVLGAAGAVSLAPRRAS